MNALATSNVIADRALNGSRWQVAEQGDQGGRALPAITLALLYLTFTAGDNSLGDFSAALPDIEMRLLGTITCLSLALAISTNKGTIHVPIWSIASVCWIAYMLFSSLWAPISFAAYRSAPQELIWLLIMLALAIFVIGAVEESQRIYLWWSAYFIGVLFAVASLVAGAGSQGRFSAFGGGPNVFVRVAFVGLVAAIVLAAFRKSILLLTPVPLLAAAVVLSGSRGGMAASAVALCVLLFAFSGRVKWYTRITVGVITVITLALFLYGSPLGSAVRSVVQDRLLAEDLREGDFSGRSGLYSEAIRLFLEYPLRGVGAGGFADLQTALDAESHPHNIILSSLAEAGFLGGMLFAALILFCLPTFRRALKGNPMAIGAAVLSLFVLLAAQSSGYFFDFRLFFLFMAASAFTRSGQAPDTVARS